MKPWHRDAWNNCQWPMGQSDQKSEHGSRGPPRLAVARPHPLENCEVRVGCLCANCAGAMGGARPIPATDAPPGRSPNEIDRTLPRASRHRHERSRSLALSILPRAAHTAGSDAAPQSRRANAPTKREALVVTVTGAGAPPPRRALASRAVPPHCRLARPWWAARAPGVSPATPRGASVAGTGRAPVGSSDRRRPPRGSHTGSQTRAPRGSNFY